MALCQVLKTQLLTGGSVNGILVNSIVGNAISCIFRGFLFFCERGEGRVEGRVDP